jgi:hypothetical protein
MAEPNDDPAPGAAVFVDHSGRRRRAVAVAGSALGVAILLALVVLGVGLSGVSPVVLPGLPNPGQLNTGALPGGTLPHSSAVGVNGRPPVQAVVGTLPSPRTTPSPAPIPAPDLSSGPSPIVTSPEHHTPSHSPKPTK